MQAIKQYIRSHWRQYSFQPA